MWLDSRSGAHQCPSRLKSLGAGGRPLQEGRAVSLEVARHYEPRGCKALRVEAPAMSAWGTSRKRSLRGATPLSSKPQITFCNASASKSLSSWGATYLIAGSQWNFTM
eukprot:11212769-Lingulodinium_polyedra.AAC.1